jgi:hypothetical protein
MMLTQMSSVSMMSMPMVADLVARPPRTDDTLPPALVPADEPLRLVLENAGGKKVVYVTDRRMVFVTSSGGMGGGRFESYTLPMASIAAFSTAGPGGLSGDPAVTLLLAGIGEVTMGFDKRGDPSPFVAHLTRWVGARG